MATYSTYNSSISSINVDINNNNNSSTLQFEPAVVLDVILDDSHPIFKTQININSSEWPDAANDKPADQTDKDYTWIGRVLVRPFSTHKTVEKEKLPWALPLENTGITEYPLVNEIVSVVNYLGKVYYTKKINVKGFLNNDADPTYEQRVGLNKGNREIKNNPTDPEVLYKGPISYLTSKQYKSKSNVTVLGRYFKSNGKIRSVKRFEGDTVIESRHGQSIRFSAYDDKRDNDIGDIKYADYYNKDGDTNPISNKLAGYGNPMILIRNRQKNISKSNPIINEKNAGGYVSEDINEDGSSIHITSGLTESKFKSSCAKKIFQDPSLSKEEVPAFSPPDCTKFRPPILTGDQIVINSDRIVVSSRNGETIHYSKKRYGIVTDNEYTVDSHGQIVLTTNTKTVINSPAIYLGQYDQTNEPALLGQTTVDFLYDLCDWLMDHVHWYYHEHSSTPFREAKAIALSNSIPETPSSPAIGSPINSIVIVDGGFGYSTPPKVTIIDEKGSGEGASAVAIVNNQLSSVVTITIVNPGLNYIKPIVSIEKPMDYPNPLMTQLSSKQQSLKILRDSLDLLMSKRVFLTGGGYAPGKNGGNITGGSNPTNINVFNGDGVPGEYKGKPRRENPSKIN